MVLEYGTPAPLDRLALLRYRSALPLAVCEHCAARTRRLSIAQRLGKTRKKERKQTTQGRDRRTVHRHHTGILRRGECGASRHLPLGVSLFLSLFAVCRRFSLQPSCHPAVFLLSSFSLPSLLPLSLRSPLPRSAAPPLPVGPLLSRLLLPLGAVPHRPPIPPLGCLFSFFLNSPLECRHSSATTLVGSAAQSGA